MSTKWRWFITERGVPEREVTKQEWIRYERDAGFTGSGSRAEPSTWSFTGPYGISGRREFVSVSHETSANVATSPGVGEYGRSQSHRAEANRIAREIHLQGEAKYGSDFSVDASIAIGQLHAMLALIDALDDIRAAIVAGNSR